MFELGSTIAKASAVRKSHRILASGAASSLALALVTASQSAQAEGWMVNGVFALGTGLQGGDPGTGQVAWARAKTRILAGVDLRNDEARADGMGFYGFTEIEGRASFGAEVRYERWLTSTIAFHAAVLGTITPETMIGPGVGARFGFPIANRVTLFLEPGFAAFPLGSDLPGNNVLLWGTLIGGVGVAL